MIDVTKEEMLAAVDQITEYNPMPGLTVCPGRRVKDAIRDLIRTAPEPEDVKRLVEAATEVIKRRELACDMWPELGWSKDGSDGRYERLRAALAPFEGKI